MKVLMLNGSSRHDGNTFCCLTEIGKQLMLEGIDYEIFQLGSAAINDCIACGMCSDTDGCVLGGDGLDEFLVKAREADGFVFGTPVYYAHPSGRILSFLDRAFYSASDAFCFKPGAAIAVARRGGCTASFDALNKYFGISDMPVVPSSYWNIAHGRSKGEALQDAEGMQTMRNLARNMAWLLKCIELGKSSGIHLPQSECENVTNFIR